MWRMLVAVITFSLCINVPLKKTHLRAMRKYRWWAVGIDGFDYHRKHSGMVFVSRRKKDAVFKWRILLKRKLWLLAMSSSICTQCFYFSKYHEELVDVYASQLALHRCIDLHVRGKEVTLACEPLKNRLGPLVRQERGVFGQIMDNQTGEAILIHKKGSKVVGLRARETWEVLRRTVHGIDNHNTKKSDSVLKNFMKTPSVDGTWEVSRKSRDGRSLLSGIDERFFIRQFNKTRIGESSMICSVTLWTLTKAHGKMIIRTRIVATSFPSGTPR